MQRGSGDEERWDGLWRGAGLRTGTYRNSECRGPAVIQHGAVLGVFQ
jgi:hypothetical protein